MCADQRLKPQRARRYTKEDIKQRESKERWGLQRFQLPEYGGGGSLDLCILQMFK